MFVKKVDTIDLRMLKQLYYMSVTTFKVCFFPLLTHNQSGKTALQVAEDGGHTQVVELLKKAVLNEQEQTKTGIYTKST